MRETVDLPSGVGPHDGKELSLMLAERKPLAMFYDTIPECGVIPRYEFEPYVSVGRFLTREVTFQPRSPDGLPARFVFYAQPWAVAEMAALEEIHRRIHEGSLPDDVRSETQIGRLLGYADWEIRAYLAWREHVLANLLN